MIAICEFCGKEFKTFKNWYNRVKHHTCSRDCAAKLKQKISTKVCKNCKKEFHSDSHQKEKIFCSINCSIEYKKNNPKLHKKVCKFCEKEFYVIHQQINRYYCSTKCRNLNRYKLYGGRCLNCKKEFIIYKGRRDKFCSYGCFREFSDKYSTLQELSCRQCGKLFLRNPGQIRKANWHFCSIECRGLYIRKENHYEWKPDLRTKHYKLALKQWGIKVKERDDFTCQVCGENNKFILEAHHIKSRTSYPELIYDINNGITLCILCHAKKHEDNKVIHNLILNKIKNGSKEELDS